ncbi:MAG TPA: hypothetical protein VG755_12320 [Nannocystaceae bacterium]|nr:hypothetical protein [Nannocystaceae bacterium]
MMLASTNRTGGSAAPLAPRIATCEPRARAKILAAYAEAFRWSIAGRQWVVELTRSGRPRARWSTSAAVELFGPFAPARAKQVARVYDGLVRRFVQGYEIDGRHLAPTIACFPASYHRCRTGLLGNASIFGRIRLCPRLLARPVPQVAAIVMHELMHQSLGVGDRRHESCDGSKHRCYGEGADALVAAGRHDLATRNIDNYVAFARRLAGASTRPTRS